MFEELSRKKQLIFLAGIFEGEGWFGVNQRKKEKPKPTQKWATNK